MAGQQGGKENSPKFTFTTKFHPFIIFKLNNISRVISNFKRVHNMLIYQEKSQTKFKQRIKHMACHTSNLTSTYLVQGINHKQHQINF